MNRTEREREKPTVWIHSSPSIIHPDRNRLEFVSDYIVIDALY
jgi:hypothetical protein